MERVSDVLGLKLAEAEAILGKAGISFSVKETIARKKEPVSGDMHVIRVQEKDGLLILTVCRIPEGTGLEG